MSGTDLAYDDVMRAPTLIVAAVLAAATGCILPVSTGTPLPATTVGKGRLGGAISGEAPVLDLLADGDDYDDLRGAAPAAAMTVSLAYGLTDDTDLEVAGEGALYFFILPLPTGGSLGLRHHVAATETFDIALAGRVGGVSAGAEVTTGSSSSQSEASAVYGALQGIIQLRNGWIRPMAAVNLMPFRIRRAPSSEAPYTFRGLASSVTLGLMVVGSHIQFGPYFTYTNFASERFENGFFPSFGLMLAVRPDRSRTHEPVMPATPYYGPPPPPAPYPAPAPAP